MKTIEDSPRQKHIFVVLGMARSGTSVISRALKALGIDLGNKFTPSSKCPWNPKGSWEDTEIVYQINEKVFKTLHYNWDTIRLINRTHLSQQSILPLKKLAAALLQQRFEATDYWGFKDPRTAKILPFWQSVFSELNVKDRYVIALRNPLASAQSYQRLTKADIEHGLLLWLTHLLAAINDTRGKQCVMVSYDGMMQNPNAQLERIKTQLAIPELAGREEIEAYTNTFLDKNLHHHEFSMADLKSHVAAPVAPLCVTMYEWLNRIANDEIGFEDEPFLCAWQEIQNEFLTLTPIYNYMDNLLSQKKSLQKYIYSLHKSRLWKIIYPLRKLDDALRSRRKKMNKIGSMNLNA